MLKRVHHRDDVELPGKIAEFAGVESVEGGNGTERGQMAIVDLQTEQLPRTTRGERAQRAAGAATDIEDSTLAGKAGAGGHVVGHNLASTPLQGSWGIDDVLLHAAGLLVDLVRAVDFADL